MTGNQVSDMAAPKNIGTDISIMLLQGISNRNIAKTLSVSSATVSYYAKQLGLDKGDKPEYDWSAVSDFLNNGGSFSGAIEKFGMSPATLYKAKERGDINLPIKIEKSAKEYAETIEGRAKPHHRKRLRKKMIKEGLPYKCSECGITEWRGKQIGLELDHKDGNSANNRLDNLRLLCPNCHSITPTWRGRNAKRYRK